MPDRCRDPSAGFGIADVYRNVGELFLGEYNAMDALPRSEPDPVPLVKSHSAPVNCFGNARAPSVAELFMDADFARGANDEAEAMSEKYECRGCGSRDPNKISKNQDSSLVCDRCGVVQGQYAVACDRQKMCARAEDKTDTADPVAQNAPSHAAVGMSRTDGTVESASETRARHVATLGGTRIPLQAIKKNRLGSSDSRTRTEVMRDARERGEVDAEVERKLRRVLSVVETTFDHLHLNKATEETVRKDAACVVEIAVKHARCCHGSECQIPLASKPSALFGVCAVQASLEKLERKLPSSPSGGRSETLAQNIDRVKQLRLQGSALNGTQRSVTTAAIGSRSAGALNGQPPVPLQQSRPANGPATAPRSRFPRLRKSPPPICERDLGLAASRLAGPLRRSRGAPVYRCAIESKPPCVARLSESLRRAALAASKRPRRYRGWSAKTSLQTSRHRVLSATATKLALDAHVAARDALPPALHLHHNSGGVRGDLGQASTRVFRVVLCGRELRRHLLSGRLCGCAASGAPPFDLPLSVLRKRAAKGVCVWAVCRRKRSAVCGALHVESNKQCDGWQPLDWREARHTRKPNARSRRAARQPGRQRRTRRTGQGAQAQRRQQAQPTFERGHPSQPRRTARIPVGMGGPRFAWRLHLPVQVRAWILRSMALTDKGGLTTFNATNGVNSVARIIGVDGLNRLLHGESQVSGGWIQDHNVLFVDGGPVQCAADVCLPNPEGMQGRSALGLVLVNGNHRFRLRTLDEYVLDGVCKSNDEQYSFLTNGSRDATILNIIVQGPTMVNNGFLEYDDVPNNTLHPTPNEYNRGVRNADTMRTVETYPRGSMEGAYHINAMAPRGAQGRVGSQTWMTDGMNDFIASFSGQYTTFPTQSFDRRPNILDTIYLGLRAYELNAAHLLKCKTAEDGLSVTSPSVRNKLEDVLKVRVCPACLKPSRRLPSPMQIRRIRNKTPTGSSTATARLATTSSWRSATRISSPTFTSTCRCRVARRTRRKCSSTTRARWPPKRRRRPLRRRRKRRGR